MAWLENLKIQTPLPVQAEAHIQTLRKRKNPHIVMYGLRNSYPLGVRKAPQG